MLRSWNISSALLLLVLAALVIPLPVSWPASAASVVSSDGWGVVDNRPAHEYVGAVWGSSSSDVFAVGSYGTIVHFDGHTWSPMTSGTQYHLRGVWGSSSSDVYAVGDHGTILYYNGNGWIDVSLTGPSFPALFGVWGSSSSNRFYVGEAGNILHVDGNMWVWGTYGTDTLYDVWGNSASDVYAVGDHGTILHFNGNTWNTINSATQVTLMAVWGSSASDIFAVGDYGTIVHYNVDSGIALGSYGNDLWGVWGSSLYDIYAVGLSGTILHYDGNSSGIWTTMDSGTAFDLFGVWGYYPDYDVYVAGANGFNYTGVILHYPSPTITTVSPNQGILGQTLDVTIAGTNLAGVTDVSDVSFGAGITVNSLPFIYPTQMIVNITVSPTATLGPRDVSVSDSGDTYTLSSGFEVVAPPPPPTIASLNPSQGAQGQTMGVTITGTNLTGATDVDFGDGITINSSKVDSPTQISTNISISSTAALGARDVSVTTPGGPFTLPGGFMVTQAPPTQPSPTQPQPSQAPSPTITSVSPNQGTQGQTLDVTVTGTNLTGITAVSFGAGITVNAVSGKSPTEITANITVTSDAAAGARDISITTPSGGKLPGGFTVLSSSQSPGQTEQQDEAAGEGAQHGGQGVRLWIRAVVGVAVVLLGVVVVILAVKRAPAEK